MASDHCANCGRPLSPEPNDSPCPSCGSQERRTAAPNGTVAPGTPTKDEAARELAKKHFEVEAGLTHIFRITGAPEAEVRPGEPIKLLEVNAATVPSGVMPLHFGPAPASGILYPSVIVEVTPEEFEKIKSKELKLPRGWMIGEEFPKPVDVNGGT